MKRKLIKRDSFYEREKKNEKNRLLWNAYQIRFDLRDKVEDSFNENII